MKDQEGAKNHTRQPELAQPQEPHRYRVDHYGKSRNFAAYEGQTIIAVTLYRKGAAEIMGFFAQPPSCGARHEGGYAESQVMPSPGGGRIRGADFIRDFSA